MTIFLITLANIWFLGTIILLGTKYLIDPEITVTDIVHAAIWPYWLIVVIVLIIKHR